MTNGPKILIYLLRRDLRLSDNPVFHEICQSHASGTSPHFTHVMPLYIFSAEQMEVSGFLHASETDPTPTSPYPEARSRVGGFWRCGPHRVKFVSDSVWDLKQSLEKHGSGLCIRVGRLAEVIRGALDFFDKDLPTAETQELGDDKGEAPKDDGRKGSSQQGEVVGVWMTTEVTIEEQDEEEAIQKVVQDRGKEFRLFEDEKYFVDDRDLPFDDINDLPDVYTSFRKTQEPLRERPRPTLPTPSKLPPFPSFSDLPPSRTEFIIPDSLSGIKAALLKPLGASMGIPHLPTWPGDEEHLAARSAHPFSGGETVGLERINHLIQTGAMSSYKDTRNGLVGLDFSTKLSAYLACGCITARQIHAALLIFEDGHCGPDADPAALAMCDTFRATPGFGNGENAGTEGVRFELLWRDYMRLCARKFGARLFAAHGFRGEEREWRSVDADDGAGGGGGSSAAGDGAGGQTRQLLNRFLGGRTGITFIDASQREILFTGYTSNRARQNVASFLAKHLNVDWRLGAEWYECMLVDYDVPSNWGNWQYVAGVGNDPRQGRIFNPVKQALDYDPKGEYVKTWIPELQDVDTADESGGIDEEKLMGLFQPHKLQAWEKEKLGLASEDWVVAPLVKINFSVGKRPRPNNRGRGGSRGRGRGWSGRRGRGRGRGASRDNDAKAAMDSEAGIGGQPGDGS